MFRTMDRQCKQNYTVNTKARTTTKHFLQNSQQKCLEIKIILWTDNTNQITIPNTTDSL